MKKKFSIAALLICCVTVAFAAFADLNGKWTGMLKFGEMEIPLTYTFKVEGEVLTGSIGSDQGEYKISDGKIKGNDFTFTLDFNGTLLQHTGKYYGDSTIVDSEIQGQKTHVKLTRAK